MELAKTAKQIIEALLFSSAEPLNLEKIHEILSAFHPFTLDEVREFLKSIQEKYSRDDQSLQIDEVSNAFILRTKLIFRPYIEKLKGIKRQDKLSQAAYEVLAIISHKQPITRASIDAIRGVDSSNIVCSLVDKELIHSIGKDESLGRPTLYGVTPKFLTHFGLKNLEDLSIKSTN